jgi:hypothetical protein
MSCRFWRRADDETLGSDSLYCNCYCYHCAVEKSHVDNRAEGWSYMAASHCILALVQPWSASLGFRGPDSLRIGERSLTRPTALTRPVGWLVILDIGAHPVHALALLRALMNHHGRLRSTRAGVTICTWHRLMRSGRRHELWMARVHHLWTSYHPLRRMHELRLHHHGLMTLLRRHILLAVREAPISHLRCAGWDENRLVVRYMSRRAHTIVCHWGLSHPR